MDDFYVDNFKGDLWFIKDKEETNFRRIKAYFMNDKKPSVVVQNSIYYELGFVRLTERKGEPDVKRVVVITDGGGIVVEYQ